MFRSSWIPAAILAALLLVAVLRAAATAYPDVTASGEWWGSVPAVARGAFIARGYDDGLFRPEAPASRVEAAAMATRAAAAATVASGLLAWLIATLVARQRIRELEALIWGLQQKKAAPAAANHQGLWLPHDATTPGDTTHWARHY